MVGFGVVLHVITGCGRARRISVLTAGISVVVVRWRADIHGLATEVYGGRRRCSRCRHVHNSATVCQRLLERRTFEGIAKGVWPLI